MFKSLKEKLSGWFKKVAGKEEKVQEEKIEEKEQLAKKEEPVIEKVGKREVAVIEPIDVLPEREIKAAVPPQVEAMIERVAPQDQMEKEGKAEPEEEKKKGFFTALKEKFGKREISEEEFNTLFDALEGILLENNVALEVVDLLRKGLHEKIAGKTFKKGEIEEEVRKALKEELNRILIPSFDLIERIRERKGLPFVILFFGINGSGKTTTIAKLASLLKEKGISCVLAAADTFRAASIEQLKVHGSRVGVKVIKHDYGADPAAVAFDAIKYAKQHGIQAVLIDTAGRMHTKENLLREMQKINRVAKPDLKIFIGESITGNDAVEQARSFNETIGIDGIILSKADVDEKGGAAISVGSVTGKPILYLGIGQDYEDLDPFQKEKLLESLGL